jgi:hypothetical protein
MAAEFLDILAQSAAYSSMIWRASSKRDSLGGGLSFGPSDGSMPQPKRVL